MSKGILLLNLGTPSSPTTGDVRAYLREFLMDRYVVDLPLALRWVLVNLIITPLRSRRSAAAYASIWSAEHGSPLLHHSLRMTAAAQSQSEQPMALAMRYGQPGIEESLADLTQRGVTEVLLVPLYPQYADSTHTTSIERVRELLPEGMTLTVMPPFYQRQDYIAALADSIRPYLEAPYDHLLLSYHGLPERHLQQADPTGSHCLRGADCCAKDSPAHATCYRHQVLRTSALLTAALGVPHERYSVSFQSRLGRLPWLTPYTDARLRELPSEGKRRIVVACPAFVADNLETLEEIGIQGRELFAAAGGESLTLVPCLNERPDWITALVGWCENSTGNTPPPAGYAVDASADTSR